MKTNNKSSVKSEIKCIIILSLNFHLLSSSRSRFCPGHIEYFVSLSLKYPILNLSKIAIVVNDYLWIILCLSHLYQTIFISS